MKVDVIGGGPAGLYFAILTKKSRPDARVEVVERNRPDDTFGFGIVLSDDTLNNLRQADEPSYRDIAASFAYWDDIYVHYKGRTLKSSGHGFSGLGRLKLLQILQKRAAELGVEVRFQTEDPGLAAHRDADLIVGADGINSAVRNTLKSELGATLEMRPNRFVWLGARMTLPGFTYSFRENEHGIWNLHTYMYSQGECTFLAETTDEAFRAAGLEVENEARTAAYLERVFAEELKGTRLLTNRSFWRQFPVVRCRSWHHDNVVLLGDAAHSAHWSIGSGTKLALEDAIALHQAVVRHPDDARAALRAYETERRPEAERIQHSANTSLVFFENVRRFWHMEPAQFNFALMSRSKQITYENLRKRDPAVIHEVDAWWARHVAAEERIKLARDFQAPPPLFAPFHLREMKVQNRVVVSPMCQYCAVDGTPTDWHFVHYGSRAVGGAGLMFTEMTCVAPDARITPGCTGMYRPEHAAAWTRIVHFVHTHTDCRIALQLGHAGRKGSTQLAWEEMDKPLARGNWPIVAPSPLPYYAEVSQVPKAMTRKDMDRVRDQFVAATRMGVECGFDLLELHMAHGYLLASFLSPVTNRRTDEYGGSLENRMRLTLEAFAASRAAWPADKPMGIRVSATDWVDGGWTPEETVVLARELKKLGCDYVDVSSGGLDPRQKIPLAPGYQVPFGEKVRREAGIPTMSVGLIAGAREAEDIVASGRADFIVIARGAMWNPRWAWHAAEELGAETPYAPKTMPCHPSLRPQLFPKRQKPAG
jgi:anthraniloyl-CoA monooxygenase